MESHEKDFSIIAKRQNLVSMKFKNQSFQPAWCLLSAVEIGWGQRWQIPLDRVDVIKEEYAAHKEINYFNYYLLCYCIGSFTKVVYHLCNTLLFHEHCNITTLSNQMDHLPFCYHLHLCQHTCDNLCLRTSVHIKPTNHQQYFQIATMLQPPNALYRFPKLSMVDVFAAILAICPLSLVISPLHLQ